MIKQKICLVSSIEQSDWVSCQTITQNIRKSYLKLTSFGIHEVFIPRKYSFFDLQEFSQQVKFINPDYLIFIDHLPHPHGPLQYLKTIGSLAQNLKIIFHIYGDFTYYYSSWKKINLVLKNWQILFLAASKRQVRLLQTLINEHRSVRLCPFAIDVDTFKFNSDERIKARSSLGLCEEDRMVLYAGRLSLQKNVILLSRLIAETLVGTPNMRFYLAGNFDDLGAPYFTGKLIAGSYEHLWKQWYRELPESIRNRIILLGMKSGKELLSLYCASDVFVSLSTYHDEDFGMAPLEALSIGTPSILTNWAGFSSFALNKACELVAVEFDQEGIKIDVEDFKQKLRQKLSLPALSDEQREANSQVFHDNFSISHISKLVEFHLQSEFYQFTGVKDDVNYFDNLTKEKGPAFPSGPRADTGYSSIYQNYLQER